MEKEIETHKDFSEAYMPEDRLESCAFAGTDPTLVTKYEVQYAITYLRNGKVLNINNALKIVKSMKSARMVTKLNNEYWACDITDFANYLSQNFNQELYVKQISSVHMLIHTAIDYAEKYFERYGQ